MTTTDDLRRLADEIRGLAPDATPGQLHLGSGVLFARNYADLNFANVLWNNSLTIAAALTELVELRERCERMEKGLIAARDALEFYSHPFDVLDENEEPVRVPDFYSECDFGGVADAALPKVRAALTGKEQEG